jgi:hypothetical protein
MTTAVRGKSKTMLLGGKPGFSGSAYGLSAAGLSASQAEVMSITNANKAAV